MSLPFTFTFTLPVLRREAEAEKEPRRPVFRKKDRPVPSGKTGLPEEGPAGSFGDDRSSGRRTGGFATKGTEGTEGTEGTRRRRRKKT